MRGLCSNASGSDEAGLMVEPWQFRVSLERGEVIPTD